jgi:hypothetical protein
MSGRNVNIYFQEENYSKIEKLIKERKVSKLINQLVEEWDKKEKQLSKEELRKKLIEEYKESVKNRSPEEREVLKAMEEASIEDIFTSLEKRERKNEQNK